MNQIIDKIILENNAGVTEFHKEEFEFLKEMKYI